MEGSPGECADFETPSFLLFRLWPSPARGDAVTYGARTFIVQEMERNRIARVRIVMARVAPGAAGTEEREAGKV